MNNFYAATGLIEVFVTASFLGHHFQNSITSLSVLLRPLLGSAEDLKLTHFMLVNLYLLFLASDFISIMTLGFKHLTYNRENLQSLLSR